VDGQRSSPPCTLPMLCPHSPVLRRTLSPAARAAPKACRRRRLCSARGSGPSLGDQLLDVIEGGPKLRRWYGAAEKAPRDTSRGPVDEEEGEEEEEPLGDDGAVLVTDATSALGEAVVFALLLSNANTPLRLLCSSKSTVEQRFGRAVTAVAGSVTDTSVVRSALRGCSAVVVTGPTGAVFAEAAAARLQHAVLLSRASKAAHENPLQALLQSGDERGRADPGREAAALQCAVPCTVLRLGAEITSPGGRQVLEASTTLGSVSGALSVEDAAAVTAAVLRAPPPRRARMLEVAAADARRGAATGAVALKPADRNTDAWTAALGALPERQT
jgi:hypothetical protein